VTALDERIAREDEEDRLAILRLRAAIRGLLELDGFRPRDGSVNPEWEAQILREAREAIRDI
jgi:hypothetical protein